MTKHINLHNVFLSTLGALALFLLTATVVTPAQANAVEGHASASTAPVLLAYYYGPGYNAPRYNRGPNWVGGPRCAKTCFINRWGNRQRATRCN